jgi:hypothetical protein
MNSQFFKVIALCSVTVAIAFTAYPILLDKTEYKSSIQSVAIGNGGSVTVSESSSRPSELSQKLERSLETAASPGYQPSVAPNFVPWPPPKPTASYSYPSSWLQQYKTLGEFSAHLEQALRRSGYTQFSYTLVPGGFALATRFERVDKSETPPSDTARWTEVQNNIPLPWIERIKALFAGTDGRCRLFVFFITTDDRSPSQTPAEYDQAKSWSLGGTPSLPSVLAKVIVTAGHKFYVYEYEFIENNLGIKEAGDSEIPLYDQLAKQNLLQ